VSYAVLMMDRELQDLRRRLGAIPRGRGRRIPVALRERVVAWMAMRRARGEWWCELARELGVTASTLKRWTTPRAEGARPLRPVQVIEAPPCRTMTIVSPSGLRVEGVTIADAIEILRGLA
jgi:transposase-like protein